MGWNDAPVVDGDTAPQKWQAAPVENVPTERFRTVAQGLTFGGADEAEAWARSKLNGEDYSEALADVRGNLAKYKEANPYESVAYEVGGAALPAILSSLFTGGAGGAATASRFFPTLGKMAGLGALEGGAYSFLTGEGGFADRAARVPGGAFLGGVGGMAGYAAAKGITKGFTEFMDFVNRKFGPRVGKSAEREMRRIMKDSDLSVEEAMARLESGDLLPEVNATLRSTARSFYAKDRGAANILDNVYSTRPDTLRKETMDYLQSAMGAEGNALRQFNMSDDAARAAKGADYNRIFATAGEVDDETAAGLVDAFRRVPSATKDLDELYRAKTGKKPFFRVTDEGIQFDRNPTVEEAEIMRRALKQSGTKAYQSGSGALGGEISSIERGVRGQLDEAVPELGQTRQAWSGIETAKDAFDLGRKALAKSPDEIAVQFEEVTRKGDSAVKAYRAGLVDAYRRKASTGSKASMPRLLADEERKEGAILRIVFPEDQLDGMLNVAGRASRAQEAGNDILRGSQTAITAGRGSQISPTVIQEGMDAMSGSPMAALRLAASALNSIKGGLSSEDMQAVAKMMVESNPQAFQRALEGGSSDVILRIADETLSRLSMGVGKGVRRSAVPAEQGLLGMIGSPQGPR